jgi:lysophospholipase L1-like esterase
MNTRHNPAAAVLNEMANPMDDSCSGSIKRPAAWSSAAAPAANEQHKDRFTVVTRYSLFRPSEGLPLNESCLRGRRSSMLLVTAITALILGGLISPTIASRANDSPGPQGWIGTWATAPQPSPPGKPDSFRNQTLRLIVHTSVGGTKVRIKISNTYGDQPLIIGSAHIARRTVGADIDLSSDRRLMFGGHLSATVLARSIAVSDPVDLNVPALSDLAISLFLPETTAVTTEHLLALQTSYVSPETGDSTAEAKFPVANAIDTWPFLTGVDVAASVQGAAIVAFGSSTTDGDGSTTDANRRWPDVLAERLQKDATRHPELGVLNEGIIGNRLLNDSPPGAGNPYGAALGQAGLTRFQRDVLDQSGVKYVFVCLGINDIVFPAFPFTPSTETVNAQDIISGYRQLIARAHEKGIRIIGTTIPPFENSTFASLNITFYTADREMQRKTVNEWIRNSREFDGVADFDAAVRDPSRPTRLLPSYDKGDHLHVNDAGNVAQGNSILLALFESH